MFTVYPGQRIITTSGTVRIVAYVSRFGVVYAHGPQGLEAVVPRSDAWGGEHDLHLGCESCAA